MQNATIKRTTAKRSNIQRSNRRTSDMIAIVLLISSCCLLAAGVRAIYAQTPVPGQLMISQFRENGPSGPTDEFVEIFNPASSAHTVLGVNVSGYGVFASAGNGTTSDTVKLVCVIPQGTVIPAFGYFLCTGTSYSLGNLGINGGPAGVTSAGGDFPNVSANMSTGAVEWRRG